MLCQHCNVADTWKEAMLPSYTESPFCALNDKRNNQLHHRPEALSKIKNST